MAGRGRKRHRPRADRRIHKSRSAADISVATAHNDGVTAIAWSLVGLMAASLGVLATALFSGMGRFDALGARIDAVGARFDGMGTRLDGLGARFDTTDGRLDAVGARFDTMDGRVDAMGARFDGIGARFDNMEGRIDALGARVDTLGSELRAEMRDQRNETHLLVDAIHRLDQRLTRAGG